MKKVASRFVTSGPPKTETWNLDFCVMLASEIHAAWGPAARCLATPTARRLGA